jgi:hypothetical protein
MGIDPVSAGLLAGGALVGQVVAGQEGARLQGNLARAQEAEQRRTQQMAIDAANPSPQEIAQLEQAISLNTQDIARKQKLIDSSDPALIEAGKQALELLQGKEAATLSPLKTQREKERAKLEASLRSQLGSGYANSTAGIQALSAFDEASNNVYANAQQQSLGQLLGVAQNTSGSYGLQSNIGNAANFSQLYGNQGSRMVGAITGTPISAAGSQYAGGIAANTNIGATLGNLLDTGVKGAAAYYGAQTAGKKT